MRRSIVTVLLLLNAAALQAQQQPQEQPPPRMAASSFASVAVHINSRPIGNRWYDEDAGLAGPARIAITYGQPHARGRKVEGGLIPKDTVWRFGSNQATTLHTDIELLLGSQKLGRGDYTLFVLNGAAGWELIVNRQTGQWGSDYDKSRDVARVPLVVRTMAETEETMSVYLVPESAEPRSGYAALRGVLRIKWGRTELTTPWQVVR